ncbi:HET-domain-containing protein [Cadophora sp. DSE1049]|nr:HET-domain-containing protein [Cadophora sp. DSE1049]
MSKPPLPPRPGHPILPPRPGYPYCALQPGAIRLLRISRGVTSDLICDLQVAHISRLPRYEALSYCWGDASNRIPIHCNGTPGLAITESLHSALHRLLLPNQQPRIIWADAICINQEDIKERSSQVLLMKNIYQLASSVVIWLGGPLPIRHGTKDWIRHVLRPDYTTNGDLMDKRWNAIIKSLILLLQKPWFLRTWIIQEVALAKNAVVLCGTQSASWDDFYCVVKYAIDVDYFSSTMPELYSSIQNIERARRNLALDRYPRPLDLLASFQIFQATDARDKVFGLYSLINPSDLAVLELQPDYGLDVIKVFTRAAVDCIAAEGNLDVLSFGGQDCLPDHTKLPTWVPDWSYRDRTKPLMQRFLTDLSSEGNQWPCTWKSATGSSYPVVEIAKDDGFISISGYIHDRVVETGGILEKEYYDSQPGHPALEINTLMQKCAEVLEKWEDLSGMKDNIPYRTGESAWDVYWKTFHAGSYTHGDEQSTKDAFEKWYQHFRESHTLFNLGGDAVEEIENSDAGTLSKVIAGVGLVGKLSYKASKMGWNMYFSMKKIPPSRIAAFHRVMFKTEEGHVGISSKHIKEGDAIALFQGGKLPLVIREVEEGGSWHIVGDAYIHGIMNGEAFDSSRCEMIKIG